ncbi:MAG: type II toxin-antitoxin system PemK/MazF family toxin [Actinomycetota bacterium]|nr:type II toxin-antitoxin system PemK/MazF family toxin [Actinomycetota bacterium]
MKRGEVRWADLGRKRRPVVLLTRQAVIGQLRSVLVAPCTTTVRDLPSEVAVGPGDGLPKPCVVNLDNVTLVDRGALGDVITTLGAEVMGRVCLALNLAVGCDRR